MYGVDTELKASGPALGFAVGHKDVLMTQTCGGRRGIGNGLGEKQASGFNEGLSQQRLRGHFPSPFSKGEKACFLGALPEA